MKLYLQCLTGTLLAVSAPLLWGGEISGKVTLKGTPPPELTINEAEATCGKFMTKKPLTTRHYVVGADQGLANVFVYIKSGASKAAPSGESPVLDQTSCEYVPYVMGVQVGQKYKIKNSDPTMHNVHATPKANQEFNFAQPLKDQVNEKAFDKPEVLVRMKCDVHPWMFAYIGVTEHPYFAVTDKDGKFKISGVPDGKYTVEAFHVKTHMAKGQGVTKEIEVKGSTTADFTVEIPAAP
jgi:hypothetical protein